MENNLVVQSNDLILATYSMSVKEKELLLACISQIDSRPDAPSVSKQTKFTVTTTEIKKLFYKDGNEKNVYRDLKQATNRLFEREVTIELPDNKQLRTRFVSSALFSPDLGEVKLAFADEILPYLTQLQANFTKYKLLEVTGLSSIHAIRLYELIICWIGKKQYKQTFDFDEFKEVMGIAGKYEKFSQLKAKVIEKAINEINENTNYKVIVEYLHRSRGKGYRGIEIKFHKKILDKIASKDGSLSVDTIKSIVNNVQFMNDYNDHQSLSGQGRMDTETFKREMFNIIQREPESFNKRNKGLETYLPKIKQGD